VAKLCNKIEPNPLWIPVDVVLEDACTACDLGLSDSVLQSDISTFLSSHWQPRTVDSLDEDNPLVRFRLTLTRAETIIGVSWHHTLGMLHYLGTKQDNDD
jgi:hypothetical protein